MARAKYWAKAPRDRAPAGIDVGDGDREQPGYVADRAPLVDQPLILERPGARLPCLVLDALHVPEHLGGKPDGSV